MLIISGSQKSSLTKQAHPFFFERKLDIAAINVIFSDRVINKKKSDPLNSVNFSVNAEAAAHFYLTSRLFLEKNIEFISSFLRDMKIGIIQPSINIGWQF
ncbi:MAG: hypothetical protein UHP28_01695 [Treponema sp.]|nr:hypothetical protein [Treponema sp.]